MRHGVRYVDGFLFGGLNYNRTPYGLDAIRAPLWYHLTGQMPKNFNDAYQSLTTPSN